MDIEVIDRPEAGRYELHVDGRLAGIADRIVHDGVMVLPHTVVNPELRGQGMGAHLVRRALDDARAQGLSVVPQCWYVAEYLGEHPDDQDLIAPQDRARYGW